MKRLLDPLDYLDALQVRDRFRSKFLSGQEGFELRILCSRGWVVVPFPERINERQAEFIAAEAARRGIAYGMSVTTSLKAKVEANRVLLSVDGILQFDANCMLRSFLLVPEGEPFAILEEGDLFYLVAGPSEVVSRIAGDSLENARLNFYIYASDPGWPEAVRGWLLEVSNLYASSPEDL